MVGDNDSVYHLTQVNDLWWTRTDEILDDKSRNATAFTRETDTILEMESSIMELLTENRHMEMFSFDESPILLIDNLSPRNGLRTNELVRFVEELGGRRCYNGLAIAQLAALQYEFHVLDAVFALSTKDTRSAARWGHDRDLAGLSRCDGCFMFGEDEHEDVLEDILKDEILRPAKTAILWNERE